MYATKIMERTVLERPPLTIDAIDEFLAVRVPELARVVTNDHFLLSYMGDEAASRAPMCGIMSGLISAELTELGVDNKVLICDLPGDLQEQHVLVTVRIDEEDYILDATYSQFLTVFGLNYRQLHIEEGLYPTEQYVLFKASDTQDAAQWVAQVASVYWHNHGYSKSMQEVYYYTFDEDGWDAPTHIVTQPSTSAVCNYYATVWDITRYQEHTFPERMLEDIARLRQVSP